MAFWKKYWLENETKRAELGLGLAKDIKKMPTFIGFCPLEPWLNTVRINVASVENFVTAHRKKTLGFFRPMMKALVFFQDVQVTITGDGSGEDIRKGPMTKSILP